MEFRIDFDEGYVLGARRKLDSVDKFISACATGKGRGLCLTGLGGLTRDEAWPEAMRAVIELGAVHSDARLRFLNAWTRVSTYSIREWVDDDDLLFTALRVLLPPYDGGPMCLYRGQRKGEPIGMSWTRSIHIAVKFALYGLANVDPLNLHKARIPPRRNGILLTAKASSEIISAPCLLDFAEGEFIVDPRQLKVG